MAIDYELTEEQRALATMFKEFLRRECPETLVRRVEESGEEYSPGLWRKMAEVGVQALAIPTKYGGHGAAFFDLGLFFEEAGRALLPGPHLATIAIVAPAILEAGTEEQRRTYLPAIASGKALFSLALNEVDGEPQPHLIRLQAVKDGANYRLNGMKYFVKDAAIATAYLVVARTSAESSPGGGLSLFIVDAKTPGISVRRFRVISGDLLAEVTFRDVVVPVANLLGGLDRGWTDLQRPLEKGKAALTLQMAGAADALLWTTIEYVKKRVTFGRPIGANQVVQHRMTDLAIMVYGARYQGYSVAWKLGRGVPCSDDVSMAKLTASNAYRLATNEALQFHGGYGFSMELPIQLFWRRMRLDEVILGDTYLEKELAGKALGI